RHAEAAQIASPHLGRLSWALSTDQAAPSSLHCQACRARPARPAPRHGLEALASPAAAAWPIARAVTVRLLTEPSPALLRALAALGPSTAVDLPQADDIPGAATGDAVPDTLLRAAILGAPALYPASWAAAAERAHSLANEEASMEREALKQEWVPKVPRLLNQAEMPPLSSVRLTFDYLHSADSVAAEQLCRGRVRSQRRRWVSACLRDHRADTGSRSGLRYQAIRSA